MMEVTSAVKPSVGSAFSIDSIMSRRDRDGAGASRDSGRAGSSRETERTPPRHGSPPSATVTAISPARPPALLSQGHIHNPHSPTRALHSAEAHHPELPFPRSANSLHASPHTGPMSASAATETALIHQNRAALAAAASAAQYTLHTQQAQAAAMAAAGLSAAGLEPHPSASAFATTAGIPTVPTLPSFSSLTHHHHHQSPHQPDRGLSTLQALSHKMQGLPPPTLGAGLPGAPAGLGPHHGPLGQGLMPGLAPKHVLPLYSWFSRPGGYWAHRLPGSEPSFLLPFRKPKRIRTAFSPSQLLRLEHAFEKNHYVVGQERKDLASNLNLTETQVKVWFQNRRTKYKRVKAEEDGLPVPDDIEVDDEPDSDPDDN